MDRRRSPLSILILLASFFAVFASHPAFGQRFVGPVGTALGGAGLAAVDAGEASYLNPASLPFLQRVLISAHYMLYDHPVEPKQKQFGVLLNDGSTDKLFAASFSYLHRDLDGHDGSEALDQRYRLSLAHFVVSGFSLGLAGNYLTYKQKNGSASYRQTNFDLGLLYAPIPELGLAFVADNILKNDVDVPVGIRTVPTLSLGAHGILKEIFRFRFDLVRPDTSNPGKRINARAGFESMLKPELALRIGMNWNETEDQTLMTAGFGYLGPRLSFNYAYEKDIRDPSGTRHIVDLWLPF